MKYVLGAKCVKCGRESPAAPGLTTCACGGILDIVYDYAAIRRHFSPKSLADCRDYSMWRYRPLLPVEEESVPPPLRVGWSPLYKADRLAQALGLGEYLKLGKGEEAGGGRERPSIIADAVEAVLAAVYLDGGIGSARKLIQKFILDREAEKSASRDYKTALQELVQRESGQVLGYQLIGAEGPDHAKIFSVEVDLNGIPIGQGRGRSKKEAEQNAAKAAIEKLKAGE